jgi:phosphate transport system ATP-binding protein
MASTATVTPMNANLVSEADTHILLEEISPYYGPKMAVWPASVRIPRKKITAIIGPSGCGKSTILRSINRLHETIPNASVKGRILLNGQDIYASDVDPTRVRRRIGMVFQQPNPLRARTIEGNVSAGLELEGYSRSERSRIVEESLRRAALWDEVHDRLNKAGISLSGGQQQRLCIARTLAMQPDVILMDEPCSALDPIATLRIEDLMRELVQEYTIVIVTHNMQQAARVSDMTVFMTLGDNAAGEVVEVGATDQIFSMPHDKRTEDYITGKVG